MDILQTKGVKFSNSSETGSGTASVAQAATSGRTYYVTDISGSTDQSVGTVVIKLYSHLNTGGVFWQDRVNASYDKHFTVPVRITTGSAITLNVRNTSAAGSCWVNMTGYYI